jgi:hypothetical protein
MALPWVRLDSHIASHDKILNLLGDPSARKWQAAFSYTCALGWSADQGTDGVIPVNALPFVHGTTTTARLLVKYGLWEERTNAFEIRNFAIRQQLNVITEAKQDARRIAAEKANCKRWHGDLCWKSGGCSRAVS